MSYRVDELTVIFNIQRVRLNASYPFRFIFWSAWSKTSLPEMCNHQCFHVWLLVKCSRQTPVLESITCAVESVVNQVVPFFRNIPRGERSVKERVHALWMLT